MTTYEKVEQLRSKEGISQGKLEKKIGLSNGQISKWKKNNPSAESLSKIANYFNVSIEYLLGSDVIEKDNELSKSYGSTLMYEIYCKIRDKIGLKDADVARLSGVTKSTFSDWKKGLYQPKREKLIKIADALGVSIEYLMDDGKTDFNPSNIYLSDEEQEVLTAYRNADNAQKEIINKLLRYFNNMRKNMGD